MASKIETLEQGIGRLTIEVSKDDFQEALEKAFKKNRNRFNIPGFRKGKAPLAIVLNYYGEAVLYDEALDHCLQPAIDAAFKEHEVEPFSRPAIDILEIAAAKGVVFTCDYAQRPEVEIDNYFGVEAYQPAVNVSEEEVNREIAKEQERLARLVPVSRAVAEGDTVSLNYSGSIAGVAFEGGTGTQESLKIGSHSFIPGFEEQLIGHEAGSKFEIEVSFPADYHAPDLQGKAATFAIELNEVKCQETPELNDDFVKDVTTDCETVADYKASISKRLSEQASARAKETFTTNVLKAVLAQAKVEIPTMAVNDEMENMLRSQEERLESQGLKFADFLRYTGGTRETFLERLREPAQDRLKLELVIDALIVREGLELSAEEYEAEVKRLAELYGMSEEDLAQNLLNSGAGENLKQQLKRSKMQDLLLSKAVPNSTPPVQEDSSEHVHSEHCSCGHEGEAEHVHSENCDCNK